MKLPSQLECLSMLQQLASMEKGENIDKSHSSGEDLFPDSQSTWLLNQLKGAFAIKTPAFFPFPCSSKEMFSWVERNNQISEETLQGLIYDESKLQRIKTELKEYAEDIPTPIQTKLTTPTPVDKEFATDLGYHGVQPSIANCYLWKWGEFNAFVAPQEFNLSEIKNFEDELKTLKISPDALVLMPYNSEPLENTDDYFGSELWHTFPPEEPLLWEETKVYLEALRCQSEFGKNISKNNILSTK